MNWWRDRSLTLVLLALFAFATVGQLLTGRSEYNEERTSHGQPTVTPGEYLATGHPWEALFENWESEFLQMAAFVLLTTRLVQKGSPESRRRGVVEPFDADPRAHRDAPGAPWPVRRGGLALALYEHSLSLTLLLLFAGSWVGHLLGGFAEFRGDALTHGQAVPTLAAYVWSAAPLVRITAELAERVPLDRGHGLAVGVPAGAWIAGEQGRACVARRSRLSAQSASRMPDPNAECRQPAQVVCEAARLTARAWQRRPRRCGRTHSLRSRVYLEPLSNRTRPCQGATISAARRSASLAVRIG